MPKLAFAVVLLWMVSSVHWHGADGASPAGPVLRAAESPCQLCILARTGMVKAKLSPGLDPCLPAFLGITAVREIRRGNPTFLLAELRGPPPQALS